MKPIHTRVKKLKRILFCSSNPYPPQSYGGSQSSVIQTCNALKLMGYEPFLMCPLKSKGLFGLERRLVRKFKRSSYVTDCRCGIQTYRSWNILQVAKDVVSHIKPDLVIAEAGQTMAIAKTFIDLGLPTIASVRDVEFSDMGGNCFQHPNLSYIANSTFTHSRLKERFGIDSTVIHPVIDAKKYFTKTTGKYVLHVNPYSKKGIETTMALAKLRPDVKFLVFESWMVPPKQRRSLQAKYAALANVEFRKPTKNMREVYAGAKCLIVPSVWQEAWGRVVTEAQFSGIPVIARAVGGLPESVGNGGILINASAPIDEWSSALSSIWDNPQNHQHLSQNALDYSQRTAIDSKHLMQTFVQTIESHWAQAKLIG